MWLRMNMHTAIGIENVVSEKHSNFHFNSIPYAILLFI